MRRWSSSFTTATSDARRYPRALPAKGRDLAAYGWSDLAPRLVGRPGATMPSSCKTEYQLAAEEELLTRLVALNQERAAEEARGLVRWLRADYQIPKLVRKVARPGGQQTEADLAIVPFSDKPKWPGRDTEQINILVDLLRKSPARNAVRHLRWPQHAQAPRAHRVPARNPHHHWPRPHWPARRPDPLLHPALMRLPARCAGTNPRCHPGAGRDPCPW